MAKPTMEELSAGTLTRAYREINEVPERRASDIEHLRTWLKKQPHLRARTDDQWLLAFLRGCCFSLERAKERIDNYYTVRGLIPEIFANRDPLQPVLQEGLTNKVLIPLPELDENGQRIFLLRLGAVDPNKVSMDEVFKLNFMAADLIILEDHAAIIGGNVILLDLQGVNMAHVIQLSPVFVKKTMAVLQEAYPLRTQGIHYINAPSAVDVVMNVFKDALSDYLSTKFFQHDSLESLHKDISKHILPKEYGGEAGELSHLNDAWMEHLRRRRDFFLEEDRFGVDEKKRPGKPKTSTDVFGAVGSFRQLNVD